jgi:hypothetical protein
VPLCRALRLLPLCCVVGLVTRKQSTARKAEAHNNMLALLAGA